MDTALRRETNSIHLEAQERRGHRIVSAWLTLIPSKVITILVQVIAVPTVYRALGAEQFAAYAAVTAAVSILGFLNLGMGGALVTPLSQAVANGEHGREANLLASTLLPIGVVSIFVLCASLPMLWFLPLKTLFGLAAASTPPEALRWAALLACIGTLAAVPLSVIDSARQAYQETHISHLFGTLSNAILCVGLLLVAWLAPTLPALVAVTALSPIAARLLNAVHLIVRRPYLAALRQGPDSWPLVRRLAGDGFSYMGAAAIANVLLYQWPVYYMARVQPPLESSTFAVCLQLMLLVLSFGVSLAQPLWPAIADAVARGDRRWITKTVWRARVTALAYGGGVMLAFGFMMTTLLRIWLNRPIQLIPEVCWLVGAYVLLATWEYVHWTFLLGSGAMRPASRLVLLRAAMFAALVPLAAANGPSGIMLALCGSILVLTGWSFPWLLARRHRLNVECGR